MTGYREKFLIDAEIPYDLWEHLTVHESIGKICDLDYQILSCVVKGTAHERKKLYENSHRLVSIIPIGLSILYINGEIYHSLAGDKFHFDDVSKLRNRNLLIDNQNINKWTAENNAEMVVHKLIDVQHIVIFSCICIDGEICLFGGTLTSQSVHRIFGNNSFLKIQENLPHAYILNKVIDQLKEVSLATLEYGLNKVNVGYYTNGRGIYDHGEILLYKDPSIYDLPRLDVIKEDYIEEFFETETAGAFVTYEPLDGPLDGSISITKLVKTYDFELKLLLRKNIVMYRNKKSPYVVEQSLKEFNVYAVLHKLPEEDLKMYNYDIENFIDFVYQSKYDSIDVSFEREGFASIWKEYEAYEEEKANTLTAKIKYLYKSAKGYLIGN